MVSKPTWTSVAALLLGALTVMFGVQLMRLLFVEMGVYVSQILDVGPTMVGVMGLAVFLSGLMEPVVRRALGFRRALPVVAGSLALVWLAEKTVSSLPVDLGLSILGTVLFLWSLPLLFRSLRTTGGHGSAAHAVIAFLVGLSADTAVKGVFGTIEPSWVQGIAGDIVVLGLVAAQGFLLWQLASDRGQEREQGPAASVLPYLAFGPALALQLLLFQNVAQQTVLIGWPQPAVYAWILAANLVGVAAAVELTRWDRHLPWPILALLGGLLTAMVAVEQSGFVAALVVLAGQVVICGLLGVRRQGGAPIHGRAPGPRSFDLDGRRHGGSAGLGLHLLRKLRCRPPGAKRGRASPGCTVDWSGGALGRLGAPHCWSADDQGRRHSRATPAPTPIGPSGDVEGRGAGCGRRISRSGHDLQPPSGVRRPRTPRNGGTWPGS